MATDHPSAGSGETPTKAQLASMKQRQQVRGLIVIAATLFLAPIAGLMIAARLDRAIASILAGLNAPSLDSLCNSNVLIIGPLSQFCDVPWVADVLPQLAWIALGATLILPALYAGIAYLLGRDRVALARFFPAVIRISLLAIAALLVVDAATVLLVLYAMTFLIFNSAMFYLGVAGMFAAGLALAAFSIAFESRRLFAPGSILLTGVPVDEGRLPEVSRRVLEIAAKLHAQPPARIIVGLEPPIFVAAAQVNLRGTGVLDSALTLYLPAAALRVLSEQELDAVIAHELGHFRGQDLVYSARFVPAYNDLVIALQSVAEGREDDHPYFKLARLPTIFLLSGMLVIFRHVVTRISRAREFEADRAAVEVAPAEAVVTALVKTLPLSIRWQQVRLANSALVHRGRARANLVADHLALVRDMLARSNREKFAAALLAGKTAHPLDTHPTLSERSAALGVDPQPLIAASLDAFASAYRNFAGLQQLEEELTAIENEYIRLPGVKLVPDTTTLSRGSEDSSAATEGPG